MTFILWFQYFIYCCHIFSTLFDFIEEFTMLLYDLPTTGAVLPIDTLTIPNTDADPALGTHPNNPPPPPR
jgi:hypothetical protein